MNFFKFIFFSFLVSFNCFSQGSTFYVAPSSSGGNDSNDGTISSPWETISYGISQIGSSDILYIREGIYHEDIFIDNMQGFDEGLISIEGYPNESITIDGTVEINNSNWAAYNNIAGAYYLSQNFTRAFIVSLPFHVSIFELSFLLYYEVI